jgi:hypothetical protein
MRDSAALRLPVERNLDRPLLTARITKNPMFIRLRTAECEWHTLYATRSRPPRWSPDALSHRLSAVLGDHVKIL